jgi:hypothetical protein
MYPTGMYRSDNPEKMLGQNNKIDGSSRILMSFFVWSISLFLYISSKDSEKFHLVRIYSNLFFATVILMVDVNFPDRGLKRGIVMSVVFLVAELNLVKTAIESNYQIRPNWLFEIHFIIKTLVIIVAFTPINYILSQVTAKREC